MKILKKYEAFFELDYEVGDYVKAINLTIPYAKILDSSLVASRYKIGFIFNDEYMEDWVSNKFIIDKMTESEIGDFEAMLSAKKFNI